MAHDNRYTEQKFEVVGNRFVRPDGVEKVTGKARYGADASAPGQLVALVFQLGDRGTAIGGALVHIG